MPDLHWTTERLIRYPLIEHVALSPDSSQAVYTIRVPHLTDEESEFRRQLWLSSTTEDGASPRQLTGAATATQPVWSPCASYIAFLRDAPDTHKPGIWILPADGGEPWPLTGEENGIRNAVTACAWRPDGKQIAFVTIPWDEEKERRRKAGDDVQHWRVDFPFAHLFTVDFAIRPGTLPPARQLTHGRTHINAFDWHPDGSRIAYTHTDNTLLDSWPTTTLSQVDLSAGSPTEPAKVARVAAVSCTPRYAPDGEWIACETGDEDNRWPYASHIVLYPAVDDATRPLTTRVLANVSDNQPILLDWMPDGASVLVLNQKGLGSEIIQLPADGSEGCIFVGDEQLFQAWHANKNGDLALACQDFHAMNTVYMAGRSVASEDASQRPASPRLVVQPAASCFAGGPLPDVQVLNWPTSDGLTIEGILYLPAGYDQQSQGRIPLLLHIHGGPMSIFQRQYAAAPYYYTPAALCERGIAILRCNPRGSGGYGRAFRFANLRDWGGGDYRDIQQGVDTVIEMGIADPDRLGICGWSYGGFMTSWTITQTDRFKAASIGAPVTNPMSFTATADIPSFVPDFYGGEAWDQFPTYLDHSPIFHVQNVRTPAIIQHGDADERVPLEQGLQFYSALQRRNVPVDLYIYPRQGHAITEPRLLADAMQRNLDWFTEMLLVKEE